MHLVSFDLAGLVIARHGLSDGNVAYERSRDGDDSLIQKLRGIKPHEIRLAKEGERQAQIAGLFLKANGIAPFDFVMSSKYTRAIQTANLMNMTAVNFYINATLNERLWGKVDPLSRSERFEKYPTWKEDKDRDPFHWRPDGGQTLLEKTIEALKGLESVNARWPNKRGLIVAHGETNMALQVAIEHVTPEDFNSRSTHFFMENVGCIEYRRAGTQLMKRNINPLKGVISDWVLIRDL